MKLSQKNKKASNMKSLLLMIVVTCMTQILTLLKSSIVAGAFGTSVEIDAYNFANSIVSFVFGFVASGITTVVLPSYLKSKDRKNTDSFITVLYGAIFIIVFIVIIFRYKIVGVFTNRDEMFVNIACNSLLVLLLANYLLSISDITVAYFQCEGKYNIPKVISMFSQLAVVISLLFMRELNIVQYTWIIALGLIINFFIDVVVAMKIGWRFFPCFKIKEKETIKLFKLFVPVVFSTGIYKLSLLIDSWIASRLNTGEITILAYSSQIVNMVNSLLIGNLLTYFFPRIVQNIETKDDQELFWKQTLFCHLVVCLVIAGFSTVGYQAVVLLFQHGQFSETAAYMVYIGALIYIIGQQTNIVRDLIYRYFYAKDNTSTTAFNSLLVSIVNIVVSLLLVKVIGFFGIFLGTIIASFVSLVVILKKFNELYGFRIKIKKLSISFAKNISITCYTILIIKGVMRLIEIESFAIQFFMYGTLTVLVFGVLTLIMNQDIISFIKEI